MRERAFFVVAVAALLSACTSYEYEEEYFLDVDGSGRLRISGSREILSALYPVAEADVETVEDFFEGNGLAVDSVDETSRDGRRFVHVRGEFTDWNALCRHPAYLERRCSLEETDERLRLAVSAPTPLAPLPRGIPEGAPLALRFHFPSSVPYHNSPSGIERGNIISWRQSADGLFSGSGLEADAHFDRRSVLATTVSVLGAALALVLVTIALAIYLMVRKGRRQLAEDARERDAQAGGTPTTLAR